MRIDYKQKMLQQRQNDFALQRKHQQSVQKRSEKRFWNSPFAVNILAESEILEHERSLVSRTRKSRSLSRSIKKKNETHKYLARLRGEIRKKDDGIL